MTFGEEAGANQLPVAVARGKMHPRLAKPLPTTGNRTQVGIGEAAAFGPNASVKNSDDDVRAVIGFRPETTLVSEADKLRGTGGVELTASVLEDGEYGWVLCYGIKLLGGEGGREAVENCVVDMKDASGVGELGGVPVIVGGEDRGFGTGMNPKDEGIGSVGSGERRNGRDGVREEEEEKRSEEEGRHGE